MAATEIIKIIVSLTSIAEEISVIISQVNQNSALSQQIQSEYNIDLNNFLIGQKQLGNGN